MTERYLELMFTEPVLEAQRQYYAREQRVSARAESDALRDTEVEFLRARDSFYIASVSPSGWPYVQHRGGPRGFLRVLDSRRLAFADYRGNRQMLSTGHLGHDPRVSLLTMDYPQRRRLKLLGHATVFDAREHVDLVQAVADPDRHEQVERVVSIEVVAYDWNCPKHITPRYTEEEVEAAMASLRQRVRELEAAIAGRSDE